jgi:hypothetical protein
VIRPSRRPLPTQDNTTYKHKRQTSTPSAGFEPANPATKRPQTYDLDRAANGTDEESHLLFIFPEPKWDDVWLCGIALNLCEKRHIKWLSVHLLTRNYMLNVHLVKQRVCNYAFIDAVCLNTINRLIGWRHAASCIEVVLGGVVVSVLAIWPKIRGFHPAEGDGFSKVIESAARLPSAEK